MMNASRTRAGARFPAAAAAVAGPRAVTAPDSRWRAPGLDATSPLNDEPAARRHRLDPARVHFGERSAGAKTETSGSKVTGVS
jgi:hypothetical protein